MSRRKQTIDAVRDAAAGVFEAGLDEAADRRREAAVWAGIHERLAITLPRWRFIARAWHRARARRYRAIANARKQ